MRGGRRFLGCAAWAAVVASYTSLSFAEAGAPGCTSSDGCGVPTPYCHPTLGACVECVASGNCPAPLACDTETGTCVPCTADADCPAQRPYCDGVNGCVQCTSDTNCTAEGLACTGGKCGSCGDGTCSSRELLLRFADPAADFDECFEDCRSFCDSATATLGESVSVKIGERSLFGQLCGYAAQPDATVALKATSTGVHFVRIKAPEGATSSFSAGFLRGACPGDLMEDCSGSDTEVTLRMMLEEGESATIIIDGTASQTYEVNVSFDAPPCQGPFCVPTPPDASTGNADAKQRCLEAARDRGEGECAGVECACTHCPRDYDDCQIIPGCPAVRECLQERRCTGEDCLSPGACGAVINTHGGEGAPAFRAAKALQACNQEHACAIPCADGGSSLDAGVGECTPGESRACTCGDGGAGKQACNLAGSDYGTCRCEAEPKASAGDSSCDCRLSRTGGSGAGIAVAAGLLASLAGRRRRVSSHRRHRGEGSGR